MSEVIVLTTDQLEGVVLGAISKFQASQTKPQPVEKQAETMNLQAAVQLLAENGYPTSKSQFYKLTSAGKIPCRKYGSRLVFSRSELLRWAESQAKDRNAGRQEAIHSVARSARNHQSR